MRIGINGFGRIGRQLFRLLWPLPDLEVVHVNDLAPAKTLAHLLAHDSTYGVWDEEVSARPNALLVNGQQIPATMESKPQGIPWGEREVEVVVEATGRFRKREKAEAHLDAGAERVLVTAPGRGPLDGSFAVGINDGDYIPDEHRIISIGSCTTCCLAAVAYVLEREIGILRGFMTTVHAYTNDQRLLDAPHKDLHRARSAAVNLVPTSTGAATSLGEVLPELAGKLDGIAVRAPVSCGSLIDLSCEVERATSAEELNETYRRYAEGDLAGILSVAEAPLVSSDVIRDSHSAVVAPEETRVFDQNLVKLLAWYDNEWGFSSRLVDMLQRMAR